MSCSSPVKEIVPLLGRPSRKIKGLTVHPRRLRRICEDLRRQRKAAIAPHRYETGPGQQIQIDFAEKYVNVGGEAIKVLFLSRSHYLSK